MERTGRKENIYSAKFDGCEAAISAPDFLTAVLRTMYLTEVENITCIKLVYTEEEARTK